VRNFAALVVVLGVSSFTMILPNWQPWPFDHLGPNGDFFFVALLSGTTGLVASIIGKLNGAIWYPVWLLGISTTHKIVDPPDPEAFIGFVLHAVIASPMVPVGFVTSFSKSRWKALRTRIDRLR
jgi:hypothetical protein